MEIRFESVRYEFSTSNPIGITLYKFFNILDYAPWLKELEILVHYFVCALLSLLVHLCTMKKVHLLDNFSELVLLILLHPKILNETSLFIKHANLLSVREI